MRSPNNAPFQRSRLTCSITNAIWSWSTQSPRSCQPLRLDRTSPTAPTPSSTAASQAGDNDVEARDDAGDDGLQDGSNAVNDCHEAGSKGLEERFDA